MIIKRWFIKLLEFSLYLHGILHFVELGSALYEEAYITAMIAAFGAITMSLSGIFLGIHTHPHKH